MNCRICNNSVGNKIYLVKERQLNMGDVFHYLHCGKCGTLQLIDSIADIGEYYPKNYPAFRTRDTIQTKFGDKIQRKLRLYLLLNIGIPQKYKDKILGSDSEFLHSLIGTHLNLSSAILDIGCASGDWLRNLREEGFSNLTGVDLFTNQPKDIEGWRFIRGEIFDDRLEKYDCITLHHSFEHMNEPLRVLERIDDLLSEKGLCMIRIPVMESLAWKEYGVDWYQIDAPRHFYLYTVRAMNYLCRKAELEIIKVIYDSQPLQYYVSEMYQKTEYDLQTIIKRSDQKRQHNIKKTIMANSTAKGDQAIFYIRKRKKNKS